MGPCLCLRWHKNDVGIKNDVIVGRPAMTTTSVADRALSRLVVWIACVVYLVGYAAYCFSGALDSIRYLMYMVPPILVAPLTLRRSSTGNRPAIAFLLTYVLLASMECFDSLKDSSLLSNDFIIMVFVLVSFVPMIDVGVEQISVVFACSVIYFVLAYCTTEHGGIRLLQILENGTGSGLESGYDNHQGGLVGPVYAVFMYTIGAKIGFLLALVMSLLGGKRVGVFAIIIGLVFVHLFKRVAVLKGSYGRFIVLLGTLAIINIVALNLITVSEYEYERLRMDVPIEEIMLGRYGVGLEITRAIDNRSLVQSLVGSGPGSATALSTLVSDGVLDHPHNDWLRILYDYGILGSLLITGFVALVFSTSETGAVIAITNAIIMMTDNVIMYLYYQFPIVLMLAYSARRERLKLRSTQHSSR